MVNLTRKQLQAELRIMREKGLTNIKLNAKNIELQNEYNRLIKKTKNASSNSSIRTNSMATKVNEFIKTFKFEYETSIRRGHGVWKQGQRYSFTLNNKKYYLELFNKVKLQHPLVKKFIACILELNIEPKHGVFYVEYDEGKGWTLDFDQNYRILVIDRKHNNSITANYFIVFSDYYFHRKVMSNPEFFKAINNTNTFDNLKHDDLINTDIVTARKNYCRQFN